MGRGGGLSTLGLWGKCAKRIRRRSDHEQHCSRENFLLRQVSWSVKMLSGGSPVAPHCVGRAQTGFPRTRFFMSRGWQVDAGAMVNSSTRCGMARTLGLCGWVAGAQGVSRGEATGSRSPHPAAQAPRGVLGLQTSPLLACFCSLGACLWAQYHHSIFFYFLLWKLIKFIY